MELIEVAEMLRGRGERTLVVAHSSTSLARGLDHDECVVLRDGEGEHFAARVVAIDFELDDTVYTLEVDARLPEDLATERLAGLTISSDLRMHVVVDLLGELRRGGPSDGSARLDRLASA